jgi:hypothetical protein
MEKSAGIQAMKPDIKNTSSLSYLPSWKWPLVLSCVLVAVFVICSILDLKRNLSFLLDGSDLQAAGYGAFYIASYLFFILVVPVLLIYSGILWLICRVVIK